MQYEVLNGKLDRILKELSTMRRKASQGEAINVKYISESEASILLKKSVKTLQIMRRKGKLKYTCINGRNIQYNKEHIDELLIENSSH